VVVSAFFVSREREDQIAVRREVFFFHANEIGDQKRVALFHVVGATPIKVAVFFDELKRIGRPVFAASLNDVEVTEEQDRLALAGAMNASDKIFLAIGRSGDDHVAAGESRVAKTPGHGFGGGSYVADRVSRVDFDELLEDFVSDGIWRMRLSGN